MFFFSAVLCDLRERKRMDLAGGAEERRGGSWSQRSGDLWRGGVSAEKSSC